MTDLEQAELEEILVGDLEEVEERLEDEEFARKAELDAERIKNET